MEREGGKKRKVLGEFSFSCLKPRRGERKRLMCEYKERRQRVHSHPLDVSSASSSFISRIYLWIRKSPFWIGYDVIYFFEKELSPLSAFPPCEPLHNYSIDNILLTKKKKKTSQENKGSFWICRMLIPERTEMISYFAPILQLYSNFLAFLNDE